jgi:hypothetical protein
MLGYITTSDVLSHPWIIVRTFGFRVYGRCLVRLVGKRGRGTFLECI